jgi:hypothetical protein
MTREVFVNLSPIWGFGGYDLENMVITIIRQINVGMATFCATRKKFPKVSPKNSLVLFVGHYLFSVIFLLSNPEQLWNQKIFGTSGRAINLFSIVAKQEDNPTEDGVYYLEFADRTPPNSYSVLTCAFHFLRI